MLSNFRSKVQLLRGFSTSHVQSTLASAVNEVRIAKRRQRELEDEVCLFNAIFNAMNLESPGAIDTALGSSSEGRKRVIDAHLTIQVAFSYTVAPSSETPPHLP